MQNIVTSRSRRLIAPLAVAAACAATVGTAHAVHWPLYGSDAGRSGYQPVEEPAPPFPLTYEKSAATEQNVRNSIVTSAGGGPDVQRFSFGTEGDGQNPGNVHLQRLSDGAPIGPEPGIPIDSADDEDDTFGPTAPLRNLRPAGVAFADSSTGAALGQIFAVHNDDDQSSTGDIAIARTDEATGSTVDAFGVPGTEGFTIFSSPLITGPAADDPMTADVDETGNRVLFFVAFRPADELDPLFSSDETRLFRVPITNNAATQNAQFGTVTSVEVPDGNPVASPALAFLDATNDMTDNPTAFVVVSADGANTVQTFRASDLTPGPRSGDLGDDGQTPLVPVQDNGMLAPFADAIFVAVGQPSGSTRNANTRVVKLTSSPTTPGTLTPATTSPTLAGTPAPAMALDQEDRPGGDPSGDGDLAVTTARNFFTLRSGDLAPRARFAFNDDLAGGTTGFSRTTAAVSGGFAFVARDNGQQLVLRLGDAQPVSSADFTQDTDNDDARASFGQPSISRRFVQFGSDQGVFVYRGAPGSFSVNDDEVLEGDSGTRILRFTITRSGSTADAQAVTADVTGGTATPGSDYVDPAAQTINFEAGRSTASFDVTVNGDVDEEPDETVVVTLSNPAGGAVLGDATGIGTIRDDDPGAPTTFSIGDVEVNEGASGTVAAIFTVTKNGPGGGAVTVTTGDGTATVADDDYEAATQTLTFAAGDTANTFAVTVRGDTKDEDVETFTATLSGATGGTTIADPSGTGTIVDDDDAPQPATTVSVGDASLGEGDTGVRELTFTVSLSRPAGSPITVGYATADGTATAGADYEASSGTVTFANGEQSKPLTVPVTGDLSDEADETFLLRLAEPTNAILGDAEGVGTIVDDDKPAPPVVVVDPEPVDARGISARVSPRRDRSAPFRFRTTGRLALPSGVPASEGCTGRVAVQVKALRKTLSTRRVSLTSGCAYASRVSFRDRKRFTRSGRLKFTVRFLGNDRINAIRAKAVNVRTR